MVVKLVRGCHQQAIAGFVGLLGAPGAQIARVIVRYFGSNRLKMGQTCHFRGRSRPGVVWARHLSSGAGHGAQASYSTCSGGGSCRATPGGGETAPSVRYIGSNQLKMVKI